MKIAIFDLENKSVNQSEFFLQEADHSERSIPISNQRIKTKQFNIKLKTEDHSNLPFWRV